MMTTLVSKLRKSKLIQLELIITASKNRTIIPTNLYQLSLRLKHLLSGYYFFLEILLP